MIRPIVEDIKGILGFLLDAVDFVGLHFKNPRSFTKYLLILKYKRQSKCDVLVEIGTYRGLTARRCSRNFKRVVTVEISPELARKAGQYFQGTGLKNVELIEGDGMDHLKPILEKSGMNNVLIFLDGHASGGVTASGDIKEPAVEELSIIAAFRDRVNGIIIDDFRSFGFEPDFPKKSTLLRQAEVMFGAFGYTVSVNFDQLVILKCA